MLRRHFTCAALAAAVLELKARGTTFVVMTHRTSILPVADKAALFRDVLALVAYRQPVGKTDVDGARGADSGGVIRQLARLGLAEDQGRRKLPPGEADEQAERHQGRHQRGAAVAEQRQGDSCHRHDRQVRDGAHAQRAQSGQFELFPVHIIGWLEKSQRPEHGRYRPHHP